MNKIIIIVSFIVSIILVHGGVSIKTRVDCLRNEDLKMGIKNFESKSKIKDKESLAKRTPELLSTEYRMVMNQLKVLESYSGTDMNLQLDGIDDANDVSNHYVDTEYKGVKGLKIKIVVDKFSKETDMGAVLDDIHCLEKNTDFIASEINKDNDNLIVKGEIYGI